jgi:hypothetical protein
MENKRHFRTILIGLFILNLFGCSKKPKSILPQAAHTKFDSNTMLVKENNSMKKVRGQALYLPIYSNIPYLGHNRKFDLSAFVAIHNTDFSQTMKITKVLFFDNEGKLVSNYLHNDTILQPLGAINFFVPERDQSGTGANFIVEWVSDTLINEPLIESVMIGLTSGQGVSFLSTGKILRELK